VTTPSLGPPEGLVQRVPSERLVLILRIIAFIVMSPLIGAVLWTISVTPVYGLEGGEDCTREGDCSLLGDFYFGGGDWLVVVVFALLGAIIWGLLRWRIAGKFP
jgi:hypothetical protein